MRSPGSTSLARVSVTPGRTRELNFFTLGKDDALYLVDMPGYGYAQASKAEVKGWTRLIRDYLKGRRELKRVFLLIDARHGLKDERPGDHDADGRGGGLLSGGADQGRQAEGRASLPRSNRRSQPSSPSTLRPIHR